MQPPSTEARLIQTPTCNSFVCPEKHSYFSNINPPFTETLLIRTLRHVPLLTLVTGFYCSLF